MPKTTIHPPGEKMQKAIKEFSEFIESRPGTDRRQILQKVAIKFDLSPKECDFLDRHFKKE